MGRLLWYSVIDSWIWKQYYLAAFNHEKTFSMIVKTMLAFVSRSSRQSPAQARDELHRIDTVVPIPLWIGVLISAGLRLEVLKSSYRRWTMASDLSRSGDHLGKAPGTLQNVKKYSSPKHKFSVTFVLTNRFEINRISYHHPKNHLFLELAYYLKFLECALKNY